MRSAKTQRPKAHLFRYIYSYSYDYPYYYDYYYYYYYISMALEVCSALLTRLVVLSCSNPLTLTLYID